MAVRCCGVFCWIWGLSALALSVRAQNLVPNSGFETHDDCQILLGQMRNVAHWGDIPGHQGSPDYFNTCSELPNTKAPDTGFGYLQPYEGEAFCGLILSIKSSSDANTEFREYIQIKLSDTLEAERMYRFRFHYALSDHSSFGTENFGIYLSDTAISASGQKGALPYKPQWEINQPILNVSKWQEASFFLKAKGGESYMVIGNFDSNDSTSMIFLDNNKMRAAYLFLDQFDVEKDPCWFDLGKDRALCQGDSVSLSIPAPDAQYQWSNGVQTNHQIIRNSGTYWAKATMDSCAHADTISVIFHPYPQVDLPEREIICFGDSVLLTVAEAGDAYQWQDGSSESDYLVKEPGMYHVDVTSNGCTTSDTSLVEAVDCEIAIFEMPNIITPNGDGFNDFLKPLNASHLQQFSFKIYNRWGKELFQTTNPDFIWDARDIVNGTYFWSASFYTYGFEKINRKGMFKIFR